MLGFRLIAALVAIATTAASPLEKRSIPEDIFSNLVFYFKYASSAYSDICPSPNGNTLVVHFSSLSGTQGYVARDDTRKEIIVSFRGSSSLEDFLTDADLLLTDYQSPGVVAPNETKVHSGFLEAYNSVADTVISTVSRELQAHPGYSLITSGHSLGGALSSLAAISLSGNFPSSQVTMFTYGQPRTGNPIYASWVNELFGQDKVFRGVHTTDGVPTIIPQDLGYRHHGIEYWSASDPASSSSTKMCAADGEDPTCSDSVPSAGIDPAHIVYYGILALTPFCS